MAEIPMPTADDALRAAEQPAIEAGRALTQGSGA